MYSKNNLAYLALLSFISHLKLNRAVVFSCRYCRWQMNLSFQTAYYISASKMNEDTCVVQLKKEEPWERQCRHFFVINNCQPQTLCHMTQHSMLDFFLFEHIFFLTPTFGKEISCLNQVKSASVKRKKTVQLSI